MGHWGDEWDPEVANLKEPHGRITFNFKKICGDVDNIVEATLNVTEKHPKGELIKEWAGAMIALFVIFLFSYKILIFAAIPFIFFYFYALFKIYNAWKYFKYKVSVAVLITIVLLIVMIVVSYIVHGIIG